MRAGFVINNKVHDFDLTVRQRDGIVIFSVLAEKGEDGVDGVVLIDPMEFIDYDTMGEIQEVYLLDNPIAARYTILAKQHPIDHMWHISFNDLDFIQGMKTAANWLNLPLEYVVTSFKENGVEMALDF